jgi:hypothetical protein
MAHKRFLLICYGWYYPNGGINDVDSSVDTEEEAVKWFDEKVKKQSEQFAPSISYQVFDCEKRKVINEWSSDH